MGGKHAKISEALDWERIEIHSSNEIRQLKNQQKSLNYSTKSWKLK